MEIHMSNGIYIAAFLDYLSVDAPLLPLAQARMMFAVF